MVLLTKMPSNVLVAGRGASAVAPIRQEAVSANVISWDVTETRCGNGEYVFSGVVVLCNVSSESLCFGNGRLGLYLEVGISGFGVGKNGARLGNLECDVGGRAGGKAVVADLALGYCGEEAEERYVVKVEPGSGGLGPGESVLLRLRGRAWQLGGGAEGGVRRFFVLRPVEVYVADL